MASLPGDLTDRLTGALVCVEIRTHSQHLCRLLCFPGVLVLFVVALVWAGLYKKNVRTECRQESVCVCVGSRVDGKCVLMIFKMVVKM